ncbi:MAG: LLM class F420-dependent oxidoreductase [Chloroflexales bacterium]|nr:LLM class F420-dependent oxidoreductase [Chloroflexales bacterium]
MRIGAVFPQTEFGDDPAAMRDYAQAIEALGYTHILLYDHVLGASTATRPNWSGPYTSDTPFHEVFVLLAYLAGLTRTLELVTGVLVLPQRQTSLVAKQAAELDLLSGGRLRLGVGVGWNEVEYEALGENFRNRGARSEEQIALLRELWTKPVVTFAGRYHQIDNAGIKPLPVQRPIPVWIGGYAEQTLRRVATIGDGWFPWFAPDERARVQLEQLHRMAHEAGRAPESIGIEPQLNLSRVPEAEWARYAAEWRNLGATHLCVGTMGKGFTSPDQHISALQRVASELGIQRSA